MLRTVQRLRWVLSAALAACLAHTTVHTLAQAPEVALKDLKRHVGEEVAACGHVVAYNCDDETGEMVMYLEDVRRGVELVIPREYWGDTRGRSLTDRYLSATVCARGRVAKKDGKYRVGVEGSDRISARVPAPSLPPFAPTALHTCSTGVTPPKLLREVKPTYTNDAMRGLVQGQMYLEAEVLADGTIGDIRELTTLPGGLGAQAIAAVRQWRFQPARLAGRPVSVVVLIEMTFKLK